MDFNGTSTGTKIPANNSHASRSKTENFSKISENHNPNLTSPVPSLKKISNSPTSKSVKSQKSARKVSSPQNKIRERKFVVAKKNSEKERAASAAKCKCKDKVGGNAKKCLCVAYENLRASQEEFFKIRDASEERAAIEGGGENLVTQNYEIGDVCEGEAETGNNLGKMAPLSGSVSACFKRRERLLVEAMASGPVSGSGRVAHLIEAFERLLSIPNGTDSDQKDEKESEENKEVMKWALPGLQQPKVSETQASATSVLLLNAEKLGLDSQVSLSWDSSKGSFSISSRIAGGSRRRRRNSIESSCTVGGRTWKRKQLKATCQRPFKLRTELRGQLKEEELMKKIQKLLEGEEKQRIPIAQGLPWTTDEQECLIKPPVKENTIPIDLKLHSDVRAVERAEFDHQVAEKMSLIEQYKIERERQQKLEEEGMIKRLRKELVPKAQPMPYFDRPFFPRRSLKQPTVPREPRIHISQEKKIKCCMSWNYMGPFTLHQ